MTKVVIENIKNKTFDIANQHLLELTLGNSSYYNGIIEIAAFRNNWAIVIEGVLYMFKNDIYLSFNVNENNSNLLLLAAYKTNTKEIVLEKLNEILEKKLQNDRSDKIATLIKNDLANCIKLLSGVDMKDWFEDRYLLVDWHTTYMPSFEETAKKKRPDVFLNKKNKAQYFLGLCVLYDAHADFIRVYEENLDFVLPSHHIHASEIYASEKILGKAEETSLRYAQKWTPFSEYECLPVALIANPIIQRVLSLDLLNKIIDVSLNHY